MKTNLAHHIPHARTHEGAPAAHLTATQSLRRLVLSCLLWEDEFYVDGQTIAAQIHAAADQVGLPELALLAIEARNQFNLRHVPLWLLVALIRRGAGTSDARIVGDTIPYVIQRADELGELLALYWKGGKRPLAKQLKIGLARAILKFDEYQLAKYDREAAVKLRDVLFLSHPKPGKDREALFKRIADRTLETPDTWEVALSGGADKKATFERLLRDGKLGYLALLRNLRNMVEAGVDRALVVEAIIARKGGAHRVLPFRYVAAARAAPTFEPALDQALSEAISDMKPLRGRTAVVVDVSGSMEHQLSAKSDLTRLDAAATLAAIIPGDVEMFTFSESFVVVPARRGMAGVDAIRTSQPHQGTYLGQALKQLDVCTRLGPKIDRLIVITDEQSHDAVHKPPSIRRAYMINVASNRHGVGFGDWTRIDGFSEQVLRFIDEYEGECADA